MINSWTCSCKPFISVPQSQWYVNASFWPMQKVIRIIYFISLLKVIQKIASACSTLVTQKVKIIQLTMTGVIKIQLWILTFLLVENFKLFIISSQRLRNKKEEQVSKFLKKVSLTIFCKKRSSAHPFMVINLYRNHLLHSIRYFKK